MQKSCTIALALILAGVAVCRTTPPKAAFDAWGWEDAANARGHLEPYKHILLVCVYEDSWDDPAPGKLTSYRMKGTVVRVYKGEWKISETISFVHGLDYRIPAGAPKATPGRLMFIFTNEHTSTELAVQAGEFLRYNADMERALISMLPKMKR